MVFFIPKTALCRYWLKFLNWNIPTELFLTTHILYWNIPYWMNEYCTAEKNKCRHWLKQMYWKHPYQMNSSAHNFVLEHPYKRNIVYWNTPTDWIFRTAEKNNCVDTAEKKCTGTFLIRINILAHYFVLEHPTEGILYT